MSNVRVLVTGGAGFIGSHIVDLLIENSYSVTVIDDLSGGLLENVHPKARFYKCDLRSIPDTERIIAKVKPQIVYHLAANAAESKSQFSPIDISTRNFDTFLSTLVPALKHGMKRIVVTSSIAVYGAQQAPFKETATPQPEDVYGITKYSMERVLQVLASIHNFEFVITRPHNVYGPRQNMKDPYRNVVTIFMNQILRNEEYVIYGDGEQVRCFSYIDDVARAIYKCGFTDVSDKIFNIGSDHTYTLNALSDMLRRITGTTSTPHYLPARPLDVMVATSDHTKSKKHLGYEDKTGLEEGLLHTWNYAKKQGYQVPLYGGIEIENKHIPKNWQ